MDFNRTIFLDITSEIVNGECMLFEILNCDVNRFFSAENHFLMENEFSKRGMTFYYFATDMRLENLTITIIRFFAVVYLVEEVGIVS